MIYLFITEACVTNEQITTHQFDKQNNYRYNLKNKSQKEI